MTCDPFSQQIKCTRVYSFLTHHPCLLCRPCQSSETDPVSVLRWPRAARPTACALEPPCPRTPWSPGSHVRSPSSPCAWPLSRAQEQVFIPFTNHCKRKRLQVRWTEVNSGPPCLSVPLFMRQQALYFDIPKPIHGPKLDVGIQVPAPTIFSHLLPPSSICVKLQFLPCSNTQASELGIFRGHKCFCLHHKA